MSLKLMESQCSEMFRIVERQHVQPVHNIEDMEILVFKHVNQFAFILLALFEDGGIRPEVCDHFPKNGIAHVLLVKVESFELVEKQVQTLPDVFLFLSHISIWFIPGASKALHGVLVQELQENSLAILFDSLGLIHDIPLKICEFDNGSEVELILDGFLNGNVGNDGEVIADCSGVK